MENEKKHRKKVTMKRVEAFFKENKMKVRFDNPDGASPSIFQDKYFSIVHGKVLRSGKAIAEVTALSRLSSEDMKRGRQNPMIATDAAVSRAVRGLYKLVRGKTLHNALYQGRRLFHGK